MIKYTRVISVKDEALDELCRYGGYPDGYVQAEAAARSDIQEDVKTWPIDFIGIATEKDSHLETDKSLVPHSRNYTTFIFLGQWFYRIIQIYRNTQNGFFYTDTNNLLAVSKSHKVFSLDDQQEIALSLLHGDIEVKAPLRRAA